MLVAALRRFAVLLAIVAGVTVAVSMLFGALAGASVTRSISLGCYGMGSFLLIAGFFVGNRGPARVRAETAESGGIFSPWVGGRIMRWATATEVEETINTSAIFITLGLVMIVLGIVVDSRYNLV
jgi:hypothetical protein